MLKILSVFIVVVFPIGFTIKRPSTMPRRKTALPESTSTLVPLSVDVDFIRFEKNLL